MGIYLNPGNAAFSEAVNSKIYVDKSELIIYTNSVANTEQKYICVSRPRRFGKSMTANMLAAYYSCSCDSKRLFYNLKIASHESYEAYLNKSNVIFLNIQDFWSETHQADGMISLLQRSVIWELMGRWPDIRYFDETNLVRVLLDIYTETGTQFIFIIDEWDCLFREQGEHDSQQVKYLDYLRSLLKDKPYVQMAYMTGILPIKKYGSHSALNMFDEFSMTEPKQLAEFVGFTESEVQILCKEFNMNFYDTKRWYDGYHFSGAEPAYSPRSVVASMLSGKFSNYWSQTETYEALKIYIEMNFDSLRDTIVQLLADEKHKINTRTFLNDMTTFKNADDVLTLLVHLGYLGYDDETEEVYIPNHEVATEFLNAIEGAGWGDVICAVKNSDALLQAIWAEDEKAVATGIEKAHQETSLLEYNDENSLACTLSLALYSARRYYTIIRELPAGKGFADLVFLPRMNHRDKPALIVELKWNHSVRGALAQILDREYPSALEGYTNNIILVGINYDRKRKKHSCSIERFEIKNN